MDPTRRPAVPAAPNGISPARPGIAGEIAAVALGGALGASLRGALDLAAHAVGLPSEVGTLAVNLSGTFVLGMLLARFGLARSRPWVRPFWMIGVLGSYTTFSTLALESRMLAHAQGDAAGGLLIAGSILLGLVAFEAGYRLSGSLR